MLAAILIPASVLSAVDTDLTNRVNTQIKEANAIVLELHTNITTPFPRIGALQQLAIRARDIRSRAKQLNILNVAGEDPPEELELSGDLNPNSQEQINTQIIQSTQKYQKIRQYALSVIDAKSIVFGSISASILPMSYALLGACAAVLTAFSQQLERRTFTWSYASPSRFIIAAIGGGVIGLFNITGGEGTTASPLALAFVVGYSTDVFFSFLEGSFPNLSRSITPSSTRSVAPK